ncbi:MAG: hypothetical protein AB1824_01365 [Acidobacteriota bacterium]
MKDCQALAARILAALQASARPLKRRELADLCGPHGCKVTTAEHRIREALDWLVLQGHPIMSDGSWFIIASTPAQFEAGLRLREKAVRAEAMKLRKLRGMLHRMQYAERPTHQSLPFEVNSCP